MLGLLPDVGNPYYINIITLHLATSYYFLGVSRTELESSISGISTEGEDLEDLAQDTASKMNDGSHWIQA